MDGESQLSENIGPFCARLLPPSLCRRPPAACQRAVKLLFFSASLALANCPTAEHVRSLTPSEEEKKGSGAEGEDWGAGGSSRGRARGGQDGKRRPRQHDRVLIEDGCSYTLLLEWLAQKRPRFSVLDSDTHMGI